MGISDKFNLYIQSKIKVKRINIHEYSTSDENWYDWLFDRLKLENEMKILDIGCGNGQFWINVCDRLPDNLRVVFDRQFRGYAK